MDGPRGPLRGPGSKGSEGSACLWQAGSEGGGIALWAMSIKSALRDWLSVSYGMISMLVIGSLRSPPPIRAAPDFHLKVKRLTMICASLALLQIMFAVHGEAAAAP